MSTNTEADVQVTDNQRLSKLLERVAELHAEKDRLAAEAKRINKALDEVEQLAVEALAASGLQRVRVAGKSWGIRESFHISVPSEFRERVIEIARRECPEYICVNTSQLKAWLNENKKEDGESLSAGTPFDGLIHEYREVRLSRLTLGS